jgi:tetratricopeptide (TPR) repeat protein
MKNSLFVKAALTALVFAVALPLCGQTAADYILKGDEFYAQFDNEKALEQYQLALQAEPENYEALWKASRALFDVADLMDAKQPAGAEKQRKMFTESVKYARQAIKANPDDTWGHFFLSAAMGMHVLTLGKKEQINMSKTIKAEIEKAIALDPQNDLAYHALGRWHRRMAEIGGMQRFLGGMIYGSIPKGSFEESEKNFLKAVELKPDYTNHHLELGRTYLALKKKDLAAQEFQKCLDAPITTSKCESYKKEAGEELAKLKKKGS